jgi:tetratricopeptide (TPR) repeat protein
MDNPALSTRRVSLSIAGFNRTLAIDSSFHLAYSHLVQLYNSGSVAGSGFVISADTAAMVQTPAEIARLGGEAAVARLRAAAAAKGIQIARAWVRSDEGAAQPILQLAQSYMATGAYDSALAVLHEAKDNPGAESKISAMMIPFQMVSADTALPHDVPVLLDRFTVDSMRMLSNSERMKLGWSFLAAAAMTGNSTDVARAAKLAIATDPVMAPSTVPSEPLIRWNETVLNVAMGAPVTPEVRRTLAVGVRAVDALGDKYGMQGRNMSLSGAYLAYLVTKDPLYRSMLGKWTNGRLDSTLTELDALAALDKGDTATARRIASTFPLPDSLRKVRFGMGGMRSVARADVLNRIGLVRQAAESYEATSPRRFNEAAWAEPGYALWVRSLHDRARLWVQLGERDKAIAAYNEFILRWRNADGAAADEVRQAKSELSVLRDGAVPVRRGS